MAQGKAKLTDDLYVHAPFDLIFGDRRESIKETGHLKLHILDVPSGMLPQKSMRFYVGERLMYQGNVLGDDEFGRLTKTETGRLEVWLDPRHVFPFSGS